MHPTPQQQWQQLPQQGRNIIKSTQLTPSCLPAKRQYKSHIQHYKSLLTSVSYTSVCNHAGASCLVTSFGWGLTGRTASEYQPHYALLPDTLLVPDACLKCIFVGVALNSNDSPGLPLWSILPKGSCIANCSLKEGKQFPYIYEVPLHVLLLFTLMVPACSTPPLYCPKV